MPSPITGIWLHTCLTFLHLASCISQRSPVASIPASVNIAYLSSFAVLPKKKHRSQNAVVFYDLLEDTSDNYPLVEVNTPRYPPYPYYDAPRNLFFDTSWMGASTSKDGEDNGATSTDVQDTYMKNAEDHRNGETVDPLDTSPIAEFERCIGDNYRDYVYDESHRHPKEGMKTDVAEYDAIRPGIAPWPSYEELRNEGIALRTSMFVDLDPGHPLEKHLIGKPMIRNDIQTVGEARTEQKRWLRRSYEQEWPLTYKEFSELPQDMREAYYANRNTVCSSDESFMMVLNYRRSIGKAGDKMHPMEFRYMEDSYTYTPKDSPVLGDLKNWDDPLDAPWRRRVEESIRDCVAYGWPPEDVRVHTCFDVYDITWLAGLIKIFVVQTRDEGGPMTPKELKLMLMKIEKRLETLDEEEHTASISNHMLLLASLPKKRTDEDKKKLLCRKEWNENIGKDVTVTFSDHERTTMAGLMLGSHSAMGLEMQINGKRITLPLNFIHEVNLV